MNIQERIAANNFGSPFVYMRVNTRPKAYKGYMSNIIKMNQRAGGESE